MTQTKRTAAVSSTLPMKPRLKGATPDVEDQAVSSSKRSRSAASGRLLLCLVLRAIDLQQEVPPSSSPPPDAPEER